MSNISIDAERGDRALLLVLKQRFVVPAGLLFLFVCMLFSGCSTKTGDIGESGSQPATTESRSVDLSIDYAEGFKLDGNAGFRTLEVSTDLQGVRDTLRYLFLPYSAQRPEGYDDFLLIRTPVRRIAVLSTTHIGYIDLLGCSDRIIGVARPDVVNTPSVRDRIQAGEITETGMPFSPNLEVILELDPDLIIATALPPSRKAEYNALVDAGIAVLIVSEWLEPSPIGRAEWLKIFGVFLGKEDEALEKFRHIERSYLDLAALTRHVPSKPSVITGLPFKDAWFVPGGQSYVAQLLRDAGADYHWSDRAKTGSMKMDIESVYPVALEADFWLSPGTVLNLDDLLGKDERFRDFQAIRTGNVYNNNRQLNPAGGNAYWEYGVVQPDRILKDLIMILQPDIAARAGFQNDSLTFFRPVE